MAPLAPPGYAYVLVIFFIDLVTGLSRRFLRLYHVAIFTMTILLSQCRFSANRNITFEFVFTFLHEKK